MERKEPYIGDRKENESRAEMNDAFKSHENRVIKRKNDEGNEYWKTVIIGKVLLTLFFAVVVIFLFKATPSKITVPKSTIESSKSSQTKKTDETKCISWDVDEC